MTTTTTLSISHAARVGAYLFDGAVAAGLPTNVSLRAHLTYDSGYRAVVGLHVQLYGDDFSDVHAWAAWLGIEAAERPGHEEGIVFCDAETIIDGVHVALSGNRRGHMSPVPE